ncbi:MAG TPA: phosphate ABC transporter ATP-binding protein [Anaerolineales bacterium]|nr:phosphate ABC transporter ATP-binding protein [Anaerolineales bacterium]
MSQATYRLQGLKKEYNGRSVLQVEALDIYAGEIFGLVGPSGAGKSTLLRLLNFLEPPTEGSITYKDAKFNAEKPVPLELRRQVTTVFQRPLLLNRTVKANVSYGLQLRGQNHLEGRTKAALEQVGLADLADQQARTLSGGEAQRVALARAMVLEPDVLLLDEPTANLDPFNVGLIEEIVRQLHASQGTTIVLVTHNVFQARRLAQRVALLLDSRVIEIAPVAEFFESPRDERTAAFVNGEMVY